MVVRDPYTATEPSYECTVCGERPTEPQFGRCGACGGPLRNLAVPRW